MIRREQTNWVISFEQDNTSCQKIHVISTGKHTQACCRGLQAPKALGSSTTVSSDQSKYENSFASAVTMSLQHTAIV